MLARVLAMFPREVWILFVGTAVNRFGNFVLVFLILYLTRSGYSPGQAGLAVAAYGVGGIGASLIGGQLADRFGRRNTIALSMFSGAGAILMLGGAETLPAIVTWTALMGLTAELYRPASSALLTDLTPPGDRVTAFAGYRLAINFGAMIGPAVGGLIAEASYRWLFIGDALTCVLFGIIALAALPDVRMPERPVHDKGAGGSILSDRPFLLFLIASTAAAFVYSQSHTGFALEVTDRGHSNAVYGMLLAANAFIVLLLEVPISRITRRQRRRPMIALGMLLLGVGFGLTPWGHGVPWLAFAVLIWTLGEIISAPVAGAYVSDIAPDHMRGRYHGAFTMTWSLGAILGPSLGGKLYGWTPLALWGACFGLCLAAAALVMSGRPSRVATDNQREGAR
jgi:MFS family permease